MVCSICFLSLICHLKIFMALQMKYMKALESVGGSCCQTLGSSSSSNSSLEEDSARMSSCWTQGVQTACKQLLYTVVIHSRVTKTRSKAEKTSSGRKFLRRRVTKTGWEYFAPLVCWEMVIKLWSMTVFSQTVCCLVIPDNGTKI